MKQKSIWIVLLVIITACQPTSVPTGPTIMVTVEPLRYFTEAIVDSTFKVVSMVPKGTSPETYDPTPKQLVDLAQSKAYLQIGYIGFELNWIPKLKENTPNLPFYDTSKGVDLIFAEEHSHGDHQHGGVEPHIWNSTQNAQIIAKNILDAVTELNPNHKERYANNYNELIRQIKETDKKILEILDRESTYSGFMIYHPALSYFARDYHLEQISIEEEGKEPTPAHLKRLIQACQQKDIHIVFIQPEFDTRNAKVIAEETQSQIIPINPLSYNWQEEMLHVAKSLKRKD